jgi:copper chaperone CopZ
MALRTILSSALAALLIAGVIVTTSVYAKSATAEITVKEVMCEQMCAPRLQTGLSKVDGVQKVVVSVKDQKIRITYDEAKISLKQLQEKVSDLGFTVTSK